MTPSTAYPAAVHSGAKFSGVSATRAGTATSGTTMSAPSAAEAPASPARRRDWRRRGPGPARPAGERVRDDGTEARSTWRRSTPPRRGWPATARDRPPGSPAARSRCPGRSPHPSCAAPAPAATATAVIEEPAQLRAAMPRSVRGGTKVGRSPADRNLAGAAAFPTSTASGTGTPGRQTGMGHRSMADDRRQPPDSTAPMGRFGDDDATRCIRTGCGRHTRDAQLPPGRRRAATGTDRGGPAARRCRGPAPVPVHRTPSTTGSSADDAGAAVATGCGRCSSGSSGCCCSVALLTGVWLIFTADDEPPAPQASAPAGGDRPGHRRDDRAAGHERAADDARGTRHGGGADRLDRPLRGRGEAKLTDAGLRVQVTRRDGRDDGARYGARGRCRGPAARCEPNSVVRLVVAIAPKPSASRSQDNDGDG